MITATIVLMILSVTVVTFSLLVIIVITRNKSLQNSQSCYKISMAMSDVLVAIFIIPLIINNMWYYVYNSKQSVIVQEKLEVRSLYTIKLSSSAYAKIFVTIIHSTGFITIYSLVFAAIDRLIVVTYPLFYRSHNVKKTSKYICIFIWIVSFSIVIIF